MIIPLSNTADKLNKYIGERATSKRLTILFLVLHPLFILNVFKENFIEAPVVNLTSKSNSLL
jgi:hypothetical protein